MQNPCSPGSFSQPPAFETAWADQPACSRFVQRIRRRYTEQLSFLPAGPPTASAMQHTLEALLTSGLETGAALRVLRQLVMERLVVLDCGAAFSEQASPALKLVMRAMTELAELALDVAVRASQHAMDARFGRPQNADNERAELWVVGMGKLGARELNVSSDIDLIYVYDHDGQTAGRTDGRGQISNHEYFAHQVKAIYALIGDTTEHGFVFRVDLALRPNGNSGPAAISLAALEDYFQAQGREWERFAWLKSRVVAPLASVRSGRANALRGSVLPCVFRRYLDYGVFDALRSLHRQIREHAAKRCAGHPERANDVKISRGGIREIEFTVQLLQVVRGGQFPELRTRPTVDALQRLAKAGLMPQDTADALARAYDFLRNVEHRIQYLDDQQTHTLPTGDDDLAWIAATLGYRTCCLFLADLDTHRELVAQEFDRLLGGKADCKGCGKPMPGAHEGLPVIKGSLQGLEALLEAPPAAWPARFSARLHAWRNHPKITALRDESRARLSQLVQRTAQWLADDQAGGAITEEAALRFIDWLEPLLRRESYLALLIERPTVHHRLLMLLGAAKWPARYLLKHPGVIDERANNDMLSERFDAPTFAAELQLRLDSLSFTGEDDEETCLNLLRRAHHAEVFRTLARDVEGVLSVEQVSDDLSALAQTMLATAARWCWQRLKNKHRDEPQFAIIAYGKLGGKELGYGSDLDIVFVYDDDHEQAGEVYAVLVRKLINWLTVKTSEGDLFEIDTALRPNGNSGLLVTTFEAYANYQQQRGSNTAWTWEHQAMTRAAFLLGSDALKARFEQVRLSVITAPRDAALLQAEIVAMRDKVRAAHPVKGQQFDVKHSVGGMVDAEFAVQFMVLAQARRHPQLAANLGNIALLLLCEAAGLLPAGVGQQAAGAYRTLRRVQHQARLNEAPTQVSPPALAAERAAIERLWAAVFKTPA